jgi:pyruvate dehydrogenase E1 component beta subunit
MSTDILMPALSPTMTEGKLARWLKKEGDTVSPGDVIAEIETDKAMMEVEAVDEGVIDKILVTEGTEGVAVNTPIARMNGDGEEEAPKKAAPAKQDAPPEQKAEPAEAKAKQGPSEAVNTATPEPKAAPPSDEDRFYAKTEKKTVR